MLPGRMCKIQLPSLVACRDDAIGFPGEGTEVKYISQKSEEYRLSVVISVSFME